MSSLQNPPKGSSTSNTQAQRLPAPSLFVGPSSRNASTTDLHGAASTAISNASPSQSRPAQPLSRKRSNLGDQLRNKDTPPTLDSSGIRSPAVDRQTQHTQPRPSITAASANAPPQKKDAHRTEVAWAEMQNTLEEVELNASSGTHVFGPQHAEKLARLREAQISLAMAWARNEGPGPGPGQAGSDLERADGLVLPHDGGDVGSKAPPLGMASALAAERTGGRERSNTAGSERSVKSTLEEETEEDIRLARARREANDRYFQQVNRGVLDVVEKLEEVARAMRGVEVESREIWGEGESIDTASVT
ncbi:hypothetical protein K402DRAFT_462462 [Aulographum hederae CBS 113979]|uniref:Uncharacterized protein n=1 Tax=Aulographum hederae CBS 113979 TaxID=1176131 RepID=A0A6G1H573_9PEZI|nr:hypothetical protein K402DRAFT_462462 [Aulographum hederae CBS 113979]